MVKSLGERYGIEAEKLNLVHESILKPLSSRKWKFIPTSAQQRQNPGKTGARKDDGTFPKKVVQRGPRRKRFLGSAEGWRKLFVGGYGFHELNYNEA